MSQAAAPTATPGGTAAPQTPLATPTPTPLPTPSPTPSLVDQCLAEWAAYQWAPPPPSSLSCVPADAVTRALFGTAPLSLEASNVLSDVLASSAGVRDMPQRTTTWDACGLPVTTPDTACVKTVVFEAKRWVAEALQ